MKKDDIVYAERMLEILKGKERIISNVLYEMIHKEFKGQEIIQYQNYDPILEELEYLNLIRIEYLGSNRYQIFLLDKGRIAKSFSDEIAKSKAKAQENLEKEKLDFELTRLQVRNEKKWLGKVIITALITALLTSVITVLVTSYFS